MQWFSLIVILTMLVSILGIAIYLAMWSGKAARARNHPYADAVNIAGWLGLILGSVLWPLALVWAYAWLNFIVPF